MSNITITTYKTAHKLCRWGYFKLFTKLKCYGTHFLVHHYQRKWGGDQQFYLSNALMGPYSDYTYDSGQQNLKCLIQACTASLNNEVKNLFIYFWSLAGFVNTSFAIWQVWTSKIFDKVLLRRLKFDRNFGIGPIPISAISGSLSSAYQRSRRLLFLPLY